MHVSFKNMWALYNECILFPLIFYSVKVKISIDMFDDLAALDLSWNNKPSGLGYKYIKPSIL